MPLRRIPEGSSLEAWRERPFRKRNGGLLGNGVSRDESFVDGLDVIFGAGRVAAHKERDAQRLESGPQPLIGARAHGEDDGVQPVHDFGLPLTLSVMLSGVTAVTFDW